MAAFLCVLGAVRLSDCAPPLTCYSRALVLSDEIMTLLDKIHTYHRTKACAEILPTIFLDVHNGCITSKLRDFLYVLLNHPVPYCRERPRMVLLKRKIQNLHTIITRICYRDLVFFTEDCVAIDTGHTAPYYAEDRLQLLQEEQ